MRSSNPALKKNPFEVPQYGGGVHSDSSSSQTMTIEGAVNKTGILFFLVVLCGAITWYATGMQNAVAGPLMIGGVVVGAILALITIFRPTAAPITAPLYAVAEGFFLGGISAIYNAQFNGIVAQAIGITLGTMLILLLAYRSGLIPVTQKFRLGLIAATGAIFLIYLATIVLHFFGINVPYIHQNGPIGIIFSLVVVAIAALNLVLDFDFINSGAKSGAPKYMEWYAAFSLMVTLVWLYLEILRLLAKIQSSDD